MEAKKSHDLLSTNWRPKKAGGVIQSYSESLHTRGGVCVSPTAAKPKIQEVRCPGVGDGQLSSRRERIRPSFAFLFSWGPQWIG